LVLCSLFFLLMCLSLLSMDRYKVYAYDNIDNITAKCYVVTDNNGNILINNKCNEKRQVASICKLMTTLITLEKIDNGELALDDKMLVSSYAANAEGSQAFLDAGSEYVVRDLLKSVIIASANDSAIVLAEGIGGSEKAFARLMNDKARDVGMFSTMYANSTGLPAPEQYSTAYDTAILLNLLSKFELYHEYCGIWIDSLTHPSGRVTELVNTNRMIKYYDYCEVGKTGFTDEAGYCLATKNTKNDFSIITVVLGSNNSANRFTDSMKLSNYVFANFTSERVITAGEEVENDVVVTRGKEDSIKLITNDDFYFTRRITDKDVYEIQYLLPKTIEARIEEGETVGEVLVLVDAVVVAEVPIIAAETIERENYSDIVSKIVEKFSIVGRE